MRFICGCSVAVLGLAAAVAQDPQAPQAPSQEEANTLRQQPVPTQFRSRPDELPLRGFVEAGVTVFDLTTDVGGEVGDVSDTETAGTLRGGVVFVDRAALEVDYSLFATGDDAVVVGGEGGGPLTVVRGEPDSLTSLFARGDLPLGERWSVHGRVGFSRFDVESEGVTEFDDDNGVAFGVGTQLSFGPGAGLRFDYTRLELNDTSADAATLVFGYRF